MVDAPHREDRPVIGHEQGRRVALVDRGRAGADDHLTFFLGRDIDDPKVGFIFGHDKTTQAEQGGEQGSHRNMLRWAHACAKPIGPLDPCGRGGRLSV